MPPPHSNFGIFGKVTDPGDNAINGAKIEIEDLNLAESINTTTLSSGEFARDLADLESQFNNADIIKIEAVSRGYRSIRTYTLDISRASAMVDFNNTVGTRILMVM